jgi:hypothetical protein
MSATKYQVITPPNTLKAKIGDPRKLMDASTVANAEKALAAMANDFQSWIEDDVTRLDAAWSVAADVFVAQPETLDAVFGAAHDLKGLGTTYSYPLVTRLAGSLCKLIESEGVRAVPPKSLLAAHIDAIKAVVRGHIKQDTHPGGKALAEELEAQVAAQPQP